MRLMYLNLQKINIPKDPILCRSPMRDVMSNRVSPRWQSPIGSQEVPISGLELHLTPFSNGLPLDGRVKASGKSLKDLATRHAQKKRLIRSSEVFTVAGLEADDEVRSRYKFDNPSGGLGGSVSVLDHGLLIIFGEKVLVVVAAETDGFCFVKEIHP
jgi:hypothetical protein